MKSFTRFVLLLAASATLFSFALLPGGDRYEVYLDDKLMLEEFVHAQKSVPSLNLDPRADRVLSIHYSHCGVIGTARNISIKDSQNKVLKEWHFTDAVGTKSPMTCPVKDIVALQRKDNTPLNLYYSSQEIPNGKLLVSIKLPQNPTTALN